MKTLIIIIFILMSKSAFGEFFQDISSSIKNNSKRLSYGIAVTDFNKDGRFEFIVTETETEALILENNLIKQLKPYYNDRLKDDKTYPFIKVTLQEKFPKVLFTRNIKNDGSKYLDYNQLIAIQTKAITELNEENNQQSFIIKKLHKQISDQGLLIKSLIRRIEALESY